MNSKLVLERIKQFPIAVAASVIAFVCLVFIFLRGSVTDELSAHEVELMSRMRVIDTNVKSARGLAADLEQLKSQVTQIDERLFKKEEYTSNIDFFYRLSRRVGISVSSVSPQAGADPTLGPKGLNELKLHAAMVYGLTVEGSLQEILKFLYEIDHVEPLMRVSNVDLSAASGGDRLSAKIRVLVLAQKDS